MCAEREIVMKKSILVLVVCTIISVAVVLYLKGDGKVSQSVADTSVRAGTPQQDVRPAFDDRNNAAEGQSVQEAVSVAPSVGPQQVDLPFEKNLLDGKSLSVAKIQTLLQSKMFEIQLDKFANESVADSNASELTDTYKDLLSTQFQTHKVQANLVKLTCGIETCVGLIRNGTDAEYNRWADVFFQDPATPNYGFANISVKQDDGSLEHRFVFSTDPAVNSIVAPRK